MSVISPELYQKYRDRLYSRIIDNSIKWGQGILMDGSPAGWTVDLRESILTPEYAGIIAHLFMKWIDKYRPDYVAGMTVAAGCLVSQIVLLSHRLGVPTKGLYIRREAKADGLQKDIEGPLQEDSTVLIIDDLLHSAEIALLKSIEILIKHRCIPIACAVILNFQKSGEEDLRKLGIPLHHIFTLKDLNMTPPDKPEDNTLYLPWWKGGPVNSGAYYAPKSGTVVGERRIFLGSDRGLFISINTNGVPQWFFPVGETYRGIQTSPVYRKGRVYFGAYDGWTYCLKASSGEVLWKEKWGDWVGCSSPVYSPGTDEFFIGIEYGRTGGDLCAFDGLSGKLKWRFKTEHYVTCAPGLDNHSQTVFAGSLDNTLYALNMEDGSEKWRFVTGGHIKGGITADPSTGYCYFTSYDGYLYCLSIDSSGEIVWKRKLGVWLYSRPVINRDRVVVTTQADYVFCLDKFNGRILWKRCLSDVWKMPGYPVVKYDRVYAGSAGGNIFVLSLKNGKVLWTFQTGGPVMAPLGVYSPQELSVERPSLKINNMKKNSFNLIKDRLYYRNDEGITNIFNSECNRHLWTLTDFSGGHKAPEHSNVILASSNDGYLYCFLETVKG